MATTRAAFLNRKDLSAYAEERFRCSGYEQGKPSLQEAAKLSQKNSSRLCKQQDMIYIAAARDTNDSLGTRSKNYVSHIRRNMDFGAYERITDGFSTAVLVDNTAVFHALTEPYRGQPPEHMRYTMDLATSNDILVDQQDVKDKTVLKRFLFASFGGDCSTDNNCLHVALSYRHEHPDERKLKGYANRQRVSERTYWDIAENIVQIASRAGMKGIRVWTDQHYAIRRSTEAWIEEALMPFAMYQVYYHFDDQGSKSRGWEGDESRAWLFAEHTFAMLGFGLCSNVPKLKESWEMFEPEDSLKPAMGRMQGIGNLLSIAGARIQSFISELSAYNDEDVDLIKRWSVSINLYGSFYEEGTMQGRQAVTGLEWVALSSVARQMNPVSITMTRPTVGGVYSCKEQRVTVSELEYRSWNGIREFAGGVNYDTKSDRHCYVSGRMTLETQMRARRMEAEEKEKSEKHLVALIASSGHGYNFVEVHVVNERVVKWRRLSEFEIVKRRGELLEMLKVPLDNPDVEEINRRWRCMDLPKGDENVSGTDIKWL